MKRQGADLSARELSSGNLTTPTVSGAWMAGNNIKLAQPESSQQPARGVWVSGGC